MIFNSGLVLSSVCEDGDALHSIYHMETGEIMIPIEVTNYTLMSLINTSLTQFSAISLHENTIKTNTKTTSFCSRSHFWTEMTYRQIMPTRY